jgi:hypothetical protein
MVLNIKGCKLFNTEVEFYRQPFNCLKSTNPPASPERLAMAGVECLKCLKLKDSVYFSWIPPLFLDLGQNAVFSNHINM